MANYLEYQLEDGSTIWIESSGPPPDSGLVKASRDKAGNVVTSVSKRFEDAFAGVKKSALVLRSQLEDMRADEVEVTFGLKAIGEAGNFAIGHVGAEANYKVNLKWNNKPEQSEK